MEDNFKAKLKDKVRQRIKEKQDILLSKILEIGEVDVDKNLKEEIKDLEIEIKNLEDVIEQEAYPIPESKKELQELEEDVQELEEKEEVAVQDLKESLSNRESPYGYVLEGNKIKIDEDEAENIRLMFSWFYKKKEPIAKISQETKIDVNEIAKIVVNPFYFGKIISKGKVKNGKHEAIIDKKLCKKYNINTKEIIHRYLTTQTNQKV